MYTVHDLNNRELITKEEINQKTSTNHAKTDTTFPNLCKSFHLQYIPCYKYIHRLQDQC